MATGAATIELPAELATTPIGQEQATAPDVDSETCAICLDHVSLCETAIIPACGHMYCVNCILRWAVCKDPCACPQCKHSFSYLYVHRHLDGTLSDCLIEESVVLLKRTSWFQEHMRVTENPVRVGAHTATAQDDYYDSYEEEDDDDYDDDEQLLDMYYSRATGRSRVVLGNRRWGENGQVRGGRMYARPVAQPAPAAASSRTPAGKAGKAAGGSTSGSGSRPQGAGAASSSGSRAPAAAGGSSSAARAAARPKPSGGNAAGSGSGASSGGNGSSSTPAAAPAPSAVAAACELHTATDAPPAVLPAAGEATPACAAAAPDHPAAPTPTPTPARTTTPSTTSAAGTSSRAATTQQPNAGASSNASASKGQGRRAKRASRRAAADLTWDDYDY